MTSNGSGISVLFSAMDSHQILTGQEEDMTGGAERQQFILARYLAKNGAKIAFATYDFEGDDKCIEEGIRIFKTLPRNARLHKLVPILAGIMRLVIAMKNEKPTVVIMRASNRIAGLMLLLSKIVGSRLIYWVSIDSDVDGSRRLREGKIAGTILDIVLRQSWLVVVQTQSQQRTLKRRLGVDSWLVPNMIEIPDEETCGTAKRGVVWIGTVRRRKSPEVFIEIARRMPHESFTMIGGPADEEPEYHDLIRERARSLSNLTFVGFMKHEDVLETLRRSAVLVNTSTIEGFPNTYLESWSVGTPVVTISSDPDGVIESFQLGYNSTNVDNAVKNIELLIMNRDELVSKAFSCAKYVSEHHDHEVIASGFLENLARLLNRDGMVESVK